MGLSKEQNKVPTKNHIALMQSLLREYPNLYLDISWRILDENFFSRDRIGYVGLINKFPKRFINGTNFIAQGNFGFEEYYDELQAVSEIHRYISDEAFRHIALGQTYFGLLGKDISVPLICSTVKTNKAPEKPRL